MTNISIHAAGLDSEGGLIFDGLRRFLNLPTRHQRFEWLYLNNPDGQARAWLAVDDDFVIGVGSAFPRRYQINDFVVDGWVLGDFCFDSQYRSLGPAVQLQRACLSVLENSDSTFCYDFPSMSMVAVYKRLGLGITGRMVRLARPLRIDRKVSKIIQNRAVHRVVTSVGNTALKFTMPHAKTEELEISTQLGLCGEEFTVLFDAQSEKLGFCLRRTAEYLNWRYICHPVARHEIITARKQNRLVGYVVWTHTDEDAFIVDLFCEKDSAIVRSLVAAVISRACDQGVMAASVSLNEAHPWRSLFYEMGFCLRDSVPIVIIPSKSFPYKIDPQLEGWYLMQGDRDS